MDPKETRERAARLRAAAQQVIGETHQHVETSRRLIARSHQLMESSRRAADAAAEAWKRLVATAARR